MYNDPVLAKDFFGRKETLDLLVKRAQALKGGYRQNVALLGDPFLGKTSLIHQFLREVDEKSLILVYLEIKKESFPDFVRRFIATLLYSYFRSIRLDVLGEFPELVSQARKSLPDTAFLIDEIISSLDSNQNRSKTYRSMLGLSHSIKNESGIPVLVIIDEFDRLRDFGVKDVFSHFGREIMVQKDTMYILVSSRRNIARKILNQEFSLLFGNFEMVELTGFDQEISRQFLTSRLNRMFLSEEEKFLFIALTSGRPFYLDSFSRKLSEVLSVYPEFSSLEIIKRTFTELLFDSKGILNQYFTRLLREAENTDILLAIAHGHNQLKKLVKALDIKPKLLTREVNQLLEKDFLIKSGNVLLFSDQLFGFWVKHILGVKERVISFDIDEKEAIFNTEIEKVITNFIKSLELTRPERFQMIIDKFNGEVVQINEKKRRLNKFQKIDLVTTAGEPGMIIAQANDGNWIFEFTDKTPDEEYIADFNKRIQAQPMKIRRKILIVRSVIDLNTSILAKEKKIWIWTPEVLNQLSGIFSELLYF